MKILTSLVLIMALSVGSASAASELWKAWPYVLDVPTITVAWSPQEGVDHHEVKMISKYPAQEWIQTVSGSTLSITFTMPRTGFYFFAVRACPAVGECTAWTYSDGAGAVIIGANGEFIPQAWIAYRRLSAPIIH